MSNLDNLQKIINVIINPANRIAVIAVTTSLGIGGAAGVTKYNKSQDPNNGYTRQNAIHPDAFFNTTPRLKSNEKIIIIMKGDEIVKITQELDEKGKVVDEREEIIGNGRPRRDNEYLRSGEELQDGDVIGEEIKYDKNDNVYKEKQILQGDDIVTVKEPIDKNSDNVEYFDPNDLEGLREISSKVVDINGKKYVVSKFVDEDGNIVEKVFDENGNVLPNGLVISDKTILDNEDNRLKRITKTVIDGKIITREDDLRNLENGDEVELKDGLFHFKENKEKGLTADDEIQISKLQRRRNKGEGEFKILKTKEQLERERIEIELNNKKYGINSQDKDYSEHKEPRTTASYPVDLTRVITIDKVIPAVLINEIKSDVPSKMVKAQIEQDIYGSHGRKILIPMGSKAIGEYKQIEDRAARRMTISWYRIITPSGINIKLEGELSDAKGASGITGEVDRRVVDRYGMAFALSVFNAAAQLSVPVDDLRYRAAADSATREFSAVTGQLIRESLKVMPTIRIPQGTRINISPMQDIWFKEPRNNQILVKPINN